MNPAARPGYLELQRGGALTGRIAALEKLLVPCTLCPRRCGVDRFAGKRGVCRSGPKPRVASWNRHFGEERPITGHSGSGTIFFSGCNLSCVFCQNAEISQLDAGTDVEYTELARIMVELQRNGCHNINLVTPTHMVYAIVRALPEAVEQGLSVPLVYNSGGYDSVETLELLEGIVDIYMPDFKYGENAPGARYSGVHDYFDVARRGLEEMYRQVGDLAIDDRGIAAHGVLVRHLVLPENAAKSEVVIDTVASISNMMYLNIMDQYHPTFHAWDHPELANRPAPGARRSLVQFARNKGLARIYSD